ncbi:MAG: hypothetical protein RR287_04535, partial [Oscillospiraceae bacterium]
LNGFTEKSAPFVDNSITGNNRSTKKKNQRTAPQTRNLALFSRKTQFLHSSQCSKIMLITKHSAGQRSKKAA